ncbi:MAG: response regulator [Bryobacteraceae bacterium]|nr:response regulator [Bryobacteraceae bacterium]
MSAGRILVVDDEPQIRRIMRTTLIGAGYEVDDAKTGEEALEKVQDYRPDLVLLDINMPGMGGVEVCKAIRSDTSIAIIMLTVANRGGTLDATTAPRQPRSHFHRNGVSLNARPVLHRCGLHVSAWMLGLHQGLRQAVGEQ